MMIKHEETTTFNQVVNAAIKDYYPSLPHLVSPRLSQSQHPIYFFYYRLQQTGWLFDAVINVCVDSIEIGRCLAESQVSIHLILNLRDQSFLLVEVLHPADSNLTSMPCNIDRNTCVIVIVQQDWTASVDARRRKVRLAQVRQTAVVSAQSINTSQPPLMSDTRLNQISAMVAPPPVKKCECKCEVINILLWVLLPLIFAAFILQMVFALIIDLMSAMFWSASTIIGWCWRKYDNLCWRIFVVCISPFLILAGLVAMPCVLNRLPNYRFLTQTRTEWYRARHMFPKEFHQWCPCCRL